MVDLTRTLTLTLTLTRTLHLLPAGHSSLFLYHPHPDGVSPVET